MRFLILSLSILIIFLFIKIPVGYSTTTGTLSGIIYDNKGKVIIGALVEISRIGNSTDSPSSTKVVISNEKGYSATLESGQYNVRVTEESHKDQSRIAVVVSDKETVMDFVLDYDPVRLVGNKCKTPLANNQINITGLVSFDNNNFMPNANVSVRGDRSFFNKKGKPKWALNTGRDGRYVICYVPIPSNDISLLVRKSGYKDGETNVPVIGGTAYTFDFDLEKKK